MGIAVYLYVLQLLLSFPSVTFTVFASIEVAWLPHASKYTLRSFRAFLIAAAGGVAVTVPQFGDFLAVLGACGNSVGIYILPHLAMLHAASCGDLQLNIVRRAASWFIVVVFGVLCGMMS